MFIRGNSSYHLVHDFMALIIDSSICIVQALESDHCTVVFRRTVRARRRKENKKTREEASQNMKLPSY